MVEEVSQIGLGSAGLTIYIYIIYMIGGLAGSTSSIQIWIISNLSVFALFFLVFRIFVLFRSGIGMVETAWACSAWMFQEGSQVDYRPNIHQLCKEYVNICRCHWGLKPSIYEPSCKHSNRNCHVWCLIAWNPYFHSDQQERARWKRESREATWRL